jgi:hypothetical protein
MKITLLHNAGYWSNLTAFFLEPVWRKYFDVQAIEPGRSYDPRSTLIFANFPTAGKWIEPWQAQGFRTVVDHTWDTWMQDSWHTTDDVLVLRNLNWSWYNESLWYKYLGYDQYKRNDCAIKSFLLLMNLSKPHRSRLYKQLNPLLGHSISSYVGAGHRLDNDCSSADSNWQRYMNPDWYDHTKFSLVVESVEHGAPWVTEKTFKPLAYQHPFVAYGTAGILSHVRELGFETFGHVVDESYDSEKSHLVRFKKVCSIVNDLTEQFVRGEKLFGCMYV